MAPMSHQDEHDVTSEEATGDSRFVFQIQHAQRPAKSRSPSKPSASSSAAALTAKSACPSTKRAVEHILIQSVRAASSRRRSASSHAPTIGNVPFTQAPLPPDVVLGVNQTQILVSIVGDAVARQRGSVAREGQDQPDARHRRDGGRVPASRGCILGDDAPTAARIEPQESPKLWDKRARYVREELERGARLRDARSASSRTASASVACSTSRTASTRCRSYETAAALLRQGRRQAGRRRLARHGERAPQGARRRLPHPPHALAALDDASKTWRPSRQGSPHADRDDAKAKRPVRDLTSTSSSET